MESVYYFKTTSLSRDRNSKSRAVRCQGEPGPEARTAFGNGRGHSHGGRNGDGTDHVREIHTRNQSPQDTTRRILAASTDTDSASKLAAENSNEIQLTRIFTGSRVCGRRIDSG